VIVAETTNKEFKEHLLKVTAAVDAILKPHQNLISSTQTLTNTINAINFPKELRQLKMIAIGVGVISLIGIVLILILCRK
jgi:hypothetical protein